MEKVTIARTLQGDQGTFGHLVVGNFRCRTLELPWNDNKPFISRIPPGEYPCWWKQSDKFGLSYHVESVSGRTHIIIHSGNFAGDRYLGFKAEVKGCILLGSKTGLMDRVNDGIKQQWGVWYSKNTLKKFIDYLGRKPFSLLIVDAIGTRGYDE